MINILATNWMPIRLLTKKSGIYIIPFSFIQTFHIKIHQPRFPRFQTNILVTNPFSVHSLTPNRSIPNFKIIPLIYFQLGQHKSSQWMVARPARLVRARMYDLPAEQTDSRLVIVNDVVFVVWRKIIDNVDSVAVVVVGGVECVDGVGGDVDKHRRRD